MIGSPLASPTRPHSRRIGVYAAAALYAGGFLAYAESKAFHFDEAYHLLTAQLILRASGHTSISVSRRLP